MLKKILNVKGAQKLSKKEQVQVTGGSGVTICTTDANCQIPGAPISCIYACIDTNRGYSVCVHDIISCSGSIGG